MSRRILKLFRRHKTLAIVAILAASSITVFALNRYTKHSPSVPTFDVKRGEFVDTLQFRGAAQGHEVSHHLRAFERRAICRFSNWLPTEPN